MESCFVVLTMPFAKVSQVSVQLEFPNCWSFPAQVYLSAPVLLCKNSGLCIPGPATSQEWDGAFLPAGCDRKQTCYLYSIEQSWLESDAVTEQKHELWSCKHLHMWICLLPCVAAILVNPGGHVIKDKCMRKTEIEFNTFRIGWAYMQFSVILGS